MKSREIRNRDLAKKIGYHETSIHKWRLGENEPSLTAIIRLCKELKCSADWLIFGKR